MACPHCQPHDEQAIKGEMERRLGPWLARKGLGPDVPPVLSRTAQAYADIRRRKEARAAARTQQAAPSRRWIGRTAAEIAQIIAEVEQETPPRHPRPLGIRPSPEARQRMAEARRQWWQRQKEQTQEGRMK